MMRPYDDKTLSADDLGGALFAPFSAGTAARPFVVAQLGQSLDGRIATPTGDSKYINRAAALDHLHRIRAAVDAVVVGIGTVLADDPLLTVRRVAGRSPHRIVIDPSGRLPPDARCLAADEAGCTVLCDEAATLPPGVRAVRLARGEGGFPVASIVGALGRLGFRRILVEGGARTIAAFVEARAIDRLHLLVAPVILGSGQTGLDLSPIRRLDEALRPPTKAYLLPDGEVLFDCALRPPADAAPPVAPPLTETA